jgi:hypothetical protein
MTDKQVKDAIAAIVTEAATELGEPIRVVPRWKLSLKGKEVLSALRSLTNDKIINGVYITRVGRQSRKAGIGGRKWEYKWRYAIFYFRSYDEGTDEANSEDKLNAILEKFAEKLEASPGLGLGAPIDDHEELQVDNIDTMDLKVHVAQCFLTVNLTVQR